MHVDITYSYNIVNTRYWSSPVRLAITRDEEASKAPSHLASSYLVMAFLLLILVSYIAYRFRKSRRELPRTPGERVPQLPRR